MEIKIYKAIKEVEDLIDIDDLFLWTDYKLHAIYPLKANCTIYLPFDRSKKYLKEIDKNEIDYKNSIQYKDLNYEKNKKDIMIKINKACFEKKKEIEIVLKGFEKEWQKENDMDIEIELNMTFKINKL